MCSVYICPPCEPELLELAEQAGLSYGWIFDFAAICQQAPPAAWDF